MVTYLIYLAASEQENGRLLFHHTLLHHKTDGSLGISIYRKPTHTDRYPTLLLPPPVPHEAVTRSPASFTEHAPSLKVNMWEQKKTTSEESCKATNTLKPLLQQPAPRTMTEPAEEPQAMAFIPYVAGLSEDVRRVCRRYNIKTISNQHPTFAGS